MRGPLARPPLFFYSFMAAGVLPVTAPPKGCRQAPGRIMGAYSLFVFQSVIVCFAGLLCWAALSDVSKYIIPNSVCLGIVGLFPAFVLAAPIPVDWAGHLVTALVMFAIGFIFFAFRLTGGGDVKLLAATALWAGPEQILPFLFAVAIAGGVLSLLTLTRLKVFQLRSGDGVSFGVRLGSAMQTHVPYGAAITAGGVMVAVRLLEN